MAKENEDKTTAPFALKTGSGGFEGRSNNIFAGLDDLEREHIKHEQNRTDIDEYADLNPVDSEVDSVKNDRSSHRNRSDGAIQHRKRNHSEDKDSSHGHSDRNMSRNRDTQSPDTQFRVPRGRAPGRNPGRRNRVPDHGSRQENWTYYCLEDVKSTEMSDRSNTQAALAFLDERRKLREQQEQMEGVGEENSFDASSAACSKGLFSFAKRNKSSPADSQSVDTEKPIAGGAKLPASDTDAGTRTEIPDDSSEAELGTDGEEQEPASKESSASSSGDSAAPDATKSSFKSRKGIKRSIRLREEDD